MYDVQFGALQALEGFSDSLQNHRSHYALSLQRAAAGLYNRLCFWAKVRWVWGKLTGQPRRLLDLGEAQGASIQRGSHYAGLQVVPIRQIRGSEGRADDFDVEFRPRNQRTRERWVGIALAREMGTPMPPVNLIRAGDIYFVRDGHHRISVARARGEEYIEAEVTVWALAPQPVTSRAPTFDLARATCACPPTFRQNLRTHAGIGAAFDGGDHSRGGTCADEHDDPHTAVSGRNKRIADLYHKLSRCSTAEPGGDHGARGLFLLAGFPLSLR